jgi:thiol-disulfide isomerase/thioredoxin
MKRFIFLCLLFTINSSFSFSNEKLEYTITGTLPDSIDNIYVYLSPVKVLDDLALEDSAIVRQGQFSFKGIAGARKDLYLIRSEQYPEINGFVILESGTISYNCYQDGGIKFACAKGTELNDLLTDSIFIPSMKIANYGQMLMNGSVDKENPEMTELINTVRTQTLAFRNSVLSFIRQNIGNGTGEYVFSTYCMVLPEEFVNEILPDLSDDIRQKYFVMKGFIQKISIGQQYIPFRGKTLDGKYLDIADMIKKEKLVLLDFFASWCVPCLKEMPVIAQLHNDYKDKGLAIISISIDESESLWKKAVEKNKMSWLQIISKKGEADDIAKLYGVYSIPHTVLINETGKIIADNLRGQDLIMKIKNILD